MKWFIAILLILLASLIIESGLLAFAGYVLLAMLFISRGLARHWIGNLTASRECNQATAEIGDTVPVVLTVKNSGFLPVPWVST